MARRHDDGFLIMLGDSSIVTRFFFAFWLGFRLTGNSYQTLNKNNMTVSTFEFALAILHHKSKLSVYVTWF